MKNQAPNVEPWCTPNAYNYIRGVSLLPSMLSAAERARAGMRYDGVIARAECTAHVRTRARIPARASVQRALCQ